MKTYSPVFSFSWQLTAIQGSSRTFRFVLLSALNISVWSRFVNSIQELVISYVAKVNHFILHPILVNLNKKYYISFVFHENLYQFIVVPEGYIFCVTPGSECINMFHILKSLWSKNQAVSIQSFRKFAAL